MLLSVKKLYGDRLGALDGEIGHVKDFYFDDTNWKIKYVVADTGSWLLGSLVLLSPNSFNGTHRESKILNVSLTRKQIEESPPIQAHKPVSLQYEEEYFRYYNLPSYWLGGSVAGMYDYHLLTEPVQPDEPAVETEFHLQSTHSISGYHIQTTDGELGHVSDFIIDDETWQLNQVVAESGIWFFGKHINIPVEHIERISYQESKIYVNLSKEAILAEPEKHTA